MTTPLPEQGEVMTNYNERLDDTTYSNCCGAGDLYDGNIYETPELLEEVGR